MAGKYAKKPSKVAIMIRWLLLLVVVLAILFAVKACTGSDKPEETTPGESTGVPTTDDTRNTEPNTEPSTEATTIPPTSEETTGPTEPFVMSTASVGVSGDVLMHTPLITAALFDDGYNFDNIFTYVSDYFESYDYMVANLEVSLGGPDAPYQGYPTFNCPDEIADAVKKAGIDMLLTANNHSYDMGHDGFHRTLQILDKKEIDHIGTRSAVEAPVYQIKEINGIKVGMVCYTYDTRAETSGRLSLNGIVLKENDRELVNSFDYSDPSAFYAEFEGVLADMEANGAETVIAFIHWGYEYHLNPIQYQKSMAQKLCDMGVDVIVGGHPHVLEPFETLTSESGNTTYCLYSTGNLISNQRRESLSTVANENYTEDGIIFGVTFQKWSDGTVEVCKLDATPTWVARENRDGRRRYTIVPLDLAVEDWKTSFDLKDNSYLEGSYERTMSIIGEGLNAAREALGQEPLILELE